MTRVKRGYVARKHRKDIIQLTSGFRGAHSRIFRTGKQQVIKALVSPHRDKGKRKRDFRRLWITRINAAARNNGVSYTKSIQHSYKNQVFLNRKILAQIAILDISSSSTILREVNE
uniref:Large ribosomal subunit protein bL20c n=19 Tax=Isoetes TaxID=13838 RepID=A0A3G2BVQ2_9TRAC|nr:ribosomal protein L20 [Isoetes flaccida]YP_009498594.1 ribosomal protein L20 [Isoetes butleri]YP_009498678.1 ribosomal protein L20 [Isoetes melanospora]YP_009498762.1 ribosomal protein L20 [Isoetes nuttallii]YP_009498846.1 ribosomal protein L20 [Isoetes valida]YP_009528716.1 ribosomal protein L20 [Isoetes mattaponica]YP_009536092.1 ribosomal protein L20 [Isoetes graniticola]YP_009555505.1 ribosomal protein L20 [Isoetes malinverniana]YP_009563739.1 ribosomal protein L20 [Isoetes yunguiens